MKYLYSYKGKEPTILPSRIRLEDGSTRTSLNELSHDHLKNLEFDGPIIMPNYDENTQKIKWIGKEYKVIDLTENEIIQKKEEKLQQKKDNINYFEFWNCLKRTSVYKKLRKLSNQSLVANSICTELISLFADAKFKSADQTSIQICLNILFLSVEFDDIEIEEVWDIMKKNNLDVYYTLPDKEFLLSHRYNFETGEILNPKPYESWILSDGNWVAPMPYPTDGKSYNWNEDKLNWVEFKI